MKRSWENNGHYITKSLNLWENTKIYQSLLNAVDTEFLTSRKGKKKDFGIISLPV